MKGRKIISGALAIVILLFVGLSAFAAVVNTPEQRKEIAANFMLLLAAENYQSAHASFNRTMKQALPPTKLKMIWNMLKKQIGPYGKIESFEVQKYTVTVRCRFRNAPLNVKISIDNAGQLTGLYFLPASLKTRASKAIVPKGVREKHVKVDIGDNMILPGTLTIPKKSHKIPAVILVHGSGPQDRDETIGPNKPFYDLAMGLAEHGIMVLRYDKRTKKHPGMDPSKITVDQETIDDVVKMYDYLRTQKHIDPTKIFILGHSLGGMLIPRIAAKVPEATGFILFAAPARPLEDLILEQFRYINQLKPGTVDVKDIEKKVKMVKSLELSKDTPTSELPLRVPAAYWLDLREYHQVKAAEKIKRPLLILQGGRDYQVTLQDFKLWKKVLTGHKNVEFKLYPNLNHLFMTGKGKATPDEYAVQNHVDQKVISDISNWIKRQSH